MASYSWYTLLRLLEVTILFQSCNEYRHCLQSTDIMSKLNQQKICSVIEGSGGASLLLAQTFDT